VPRGPGRDAELTGAPAPRGPGRDAELTGAPAEREEGLPGSSGLQQSSPPPGRSGTRAIAGALLLVLATLARPEGLLYFALAAGLRLLAALRRRRLSRLEPLFLLTYALPIGALFLWRHAYYGEWLPNTYYAKATGGAGRIDEGARYLLSFFDASLLQGLVLLPISGAALRLHRGARPLFLAAVLATALYALRIGGDAFAGARFFVPVLAPLYLLVQDGLSTFLSSSRLIRPLVALFVLALGLLTVLGSGPALARQAEIATAMTRNRTYLGKLLHEITPPDAVIALNTVGALPYYAGRPTIDLYGLTDAHIAHLPTRPVPGGGTGHEKGDGAYVLARRPDYILLRNVWLADVPIEAHRSLQGVSEREIAADPTFLELYEPVDLRLRPDLMFGLYKRRDIDREALLARFKAVDPAAIGPVKELTAERGAEVLYFQQGNRLIREGRLEAARRAFEKALELYPDAGDVHLAMGQLLERLNELPEARAHYKRATELLAESAQAWLGLGNVEAKLGQPGAAVSAYRRSLFVDPTRVDAYANLAGQLLKEGRFAEAIPALRGGLARAPDDLELWLELGTAAASLQRWSDAREAQSRLEQIAPADPRTVAFQKWLAGRLPAVR
jgi:tetratricopeptide (TPR) repeat protein